jgi:Arc/MetJ-type ribon-helix-helix transcriptional regulator
MKTYQVTLPDEFAAFVDRMIAEWKWESVDYVVMAALARLMTEMDHDDTAGQEWLKKEIQKGIDSLDRGEGVEGPTVMARLRTKLDAAKARQ